MRNRKRSDLVFLLILLLFRGVLDYSYYLLGIAQHDIEFDLRFNIVKFIFSYLAIIMLSLPTFKSSKLSLLFFRMIIFFTIAPISCVYAWRNESSVFFWLVFATYYLAEIISLKTNIRMPSGAKARDLSKYVYIGSLLLSILTLLLMYRTNGVPNLTTFLLETVYEVRANFSVSSYLTYLLFVTALVLVPFGLADAYTRKKTWLFCFYFILQILLFLWSGNKAWLFSLLMILGIIVVLRMKKGFNLFFAGVCTIAVIGCFFGKSDVGFGVFSLINRRVLLDPAALKFFYYDYFIVNHHHTVGLAGTLLAPIINFFQTPGPAHDYAFEISSIYTDSPSNAVTGLYGGDIAHFGLFSFLLVPIALIFFSLLVEVSNKKSGTMFTILLFSFLAYFFNDQKIVPYFLDFRGVFLVLIVYFYSCSSFYKGKIAPNAIYE